MSDEKPSLQQLLALARQRRLWPEVDCQDKSTLLPTTPSPVMAAPQSIEAEAEAEAAAAADGRASRADRAGAGVKTGRRPADARGARGALCRRTRARPRRSLGSTR